MANPCRVIEQTECREQVEVSSSDVEQSLLRSVVGAGKTVLANRIMFTNTMDRNGGREKFSSDVTSFIDLDLLMKARALFLLCFPTTIYLSVCDKTENGASHPLGFQIGPTGPVLF
jgi:hypothetical protein